VSRPALWGPVLASSSVLSLALVGDALIYAVLPVHAESFGISLMWVGILLSANRFVRVFAYALVARVTAVVGVRRMCITATAAAVVSTGLYGLGHGPAVLLGARVLWGIAYAVLLLATLAYAVEQRAGVGARIGWSRAVQRIGPITALLAGAWLTGVLGPRNVFMVLAAITALALPLAFTLPRDAAPAAPAPRAPALGRPDTMDVLFFLQGLGVDGVFALSITLILAQRHDLAVAVLSGGALLAMRHLGEAVAAPLFGAIGDRYGAARVFLLSALITSIGFAGIALDLTFAGAIVMLVFRGALASLGPAAVVQATRDDAPVMVPLARMQAWRDLGAAIGPLVTGYALTLVSAQWLHGMLAGLTLVGVGAWWRAVGRHAYP
jgi:MFS transporter, DHA1 family, inner membrane transport protein